MARGKQLSREEMMDEVIKKYGFEHEITILFCKGCEDEHVSYSRIKSVFVMLMA